MNDWQIPPRDPNENPFDMARALAQETLTPMRNQHVVSRVVLRGFAAPGHGGQGASLVPYDVERGRLGKSLGIKGCGKVPDFVKYASGSVEQLWKETEDVLGPAISKARAGTATLSENDRLVLKRAIALHFVRSPRFRRIHDDSVVSSMADVRERIVRDRPDLLARRFVSVYGLEPAGTEALEHMLDQAVDPWVEFVDSGALFRVSIASMYERIRDTFIRKPLEVWRSSPATEFLISDSPAITVRYHHDGEATRAQPNVAVGDAHVVAMPLASDLMVALGPTEKQDILLDEVVRTMNRLQLQSAHRYAYLRPGSSWTRPEGLRQLLA